VKYKSVRLSLALFWLGLYFWFRSGFTDTTDAVVVVCLFFYATRSVWVGL
jgi:hypothetical protein